MNARIKMKKTIVIISAAVIVIVCASIFISNANRKDVRTASVARGKIETETEIDGTVVAASESAVYSTESGKVKYVAIKEGSNVKSGDVLLTLDTSELEKEMAASSAVYSDGSDDMKDKIIAMSQKTGCDIGLYNAVMRGETETTSSEAAAAFAEKKADIESRMENMTVKSPADGMIAGLSVKEGDIVTPAKPLMTVSNREDLRIVASIGENLVSKVKTGDSCRIDINAAGVVTDGTITNVSDSLTGDAQGNKTCSVTITPSSKLSCPVGASAEISLTTESKSDILTVDADVITENNAVYKVKGDGTVERALVNVGISGEDKTEILSGLEEGDRVVTYCKSELHEGDKVNIID